MEQFTVEDLTPEQKQKWYDTMSLMGWKCPGFQHLFYRLLTKSQNKYYAVPTKRVPVAATDAKNILINPDTFFEYPLAERLFITGHEIMHNVYGDVELLHRCHQTDRVPMHDGTDFPFKEKFMQHAMDYRINALLVDSKIGALPKGALYDRKIAEPNDSVLDVYKKLYEQHDGDDGALGGGGFDTVLAPGQSMGMDPNQAAQQRSQSTWQVELAAAEMIESMKAQGKMPASLKRMFQMLLEPEVPWAEKLRTVFARTVGSGSYNWRRPDRRFIVRDIYLPSRSGFGAGWVVCWGDTSGSISAAELEKFFGEIAGIVEDARPRRLTVLWGDAAVQNVDEIEDAGDLAKVKSRGVGGGGGTELEPIFEWITDQHEVPDIFVGFTDGYVGFPETPQFPCVWASTTDKDYPYGEVIKINPPKVRD